MSELTRREAMRLAAGTGLATAVGATAAAADHTAAAAQGGTETNIQAYITAAPGVSLEFGGMQMSAQKSPYDQMVKATLKGDYYEFVEPTHKTVISFPKAGYLYFTLCYTKTGIYMNVFYDDKTAKNYAKWCCVTCNGMTACGPGICVTCNGVKICC